MFVTIIDREQIVKGLKQVWLGLIPFVEREFKQHLGEGWIAQASQELNRLQKMTTGQLAGI